MKKLNFLLLLYSLLGLTAIQTKDNLDLVVNTGWFLLKYPVWKHNFLNKYSHLNIPDISLSLKVDNGAYSPLLHNIYLNPCFAGDFRNNANEWILLHEIGHAQKRWALPAIVGSTFAVSSIVRCNCGIHRSILYKNKFTADISKSMAAMMISGLYFCALANIEERRADNFANKYADKQALYGGIEAFEKIKKDIQDELPVFKDGLPSWCQRIIDPIHPTLDSRIAKIKKALRTRFDVEV